MPISAEIEITGCIYDDAHDIRFDFMCHPTIKPRHKLEYNRQIALHLNPRFGENIVVLNSMEDSRWQKEVRIDKAMVLAPGVEFKLRVRCESSGFKITVDGREFVTFKHRSSPDAITKLYVSGRVKLYNICYNCPTVICPLRDVFWRQIGGHLRRVETSVAGIVYGIGYDNTAWVYTGGWGGQFLKGMGTSTNGINTMGDIQNYYVYENQRWNPLSGYTSTGLPTDRHMWSDVTGKHKRSKDHTKLLSIHWQWISEWLVDFHTLF